MITGVKTENASNPDSFEMVTDLAEEEIGERVYHGHIIAEHFGLYGLEHSLENFL